MFDDAARWERTLEAESALFEPLRPGSRIGLVAETVIASRHRRPSELLVCERVASGMRAALEPYAGFESAAVDLLIALDEDAMRTLESGSEAGLSRTLRRLARGGHALFFARRSRAELEDAGYDDLLYEIGFAYLGTCR